MPVILAPKNDLNELSHQIIGAAHKVSTMLGIGFLEKVYENALAVETRRLNLNVEQQSPIKVRYDGVIVGDIMPTCWSKIA
jgi:GxxExxY protein